jgi:hypothetical protein
MQDNERNNRGVQCNMGIPPKINCAHLNRSGAMPQSINCPAKILIHGLAQELSSAC